MGFTASSEIPATAAMGWRGKTLKKIKGTVNVAKHKVTFPEVGGKLHLFIEMFNLSIITNNWSIV